MTTYSCSTAKALSITVLFSLLAILTAGLIGAMLVYFAGLTFTFVNLSLGFLMVWFLWTLKNFLVKTYGELKYLELGRNSPGKE